MRPTTALKLSQLETRSLSWPVTLTTFLLSRNSRDRGFEFHVVFWDHASKELREVASKFISLNAYLEHIR
jgi:hypothetical protein